MPVQIIGKYDYENVMIAKPDLRFATTFLSNKYRAYSVSGETIQDKATGEIFTKRPEDGRVVSFYQNKKYMHDLMLELKILLNADTKFVYPKETDTEAFYLSTDYDIMQIYDESEHDISKVDTVIPNDDAVTYHKLIFALSTSCNGFFCRPTSRDSDKVALNWLTSKYDNIIKNYTGTDPVYLAEKQKFTDIPEWESSNAVINYTVISYNKETKETNTTTCTDYIHINEEHCIFFPEVAASSYDTSGKYSVTVRINSLTYEKIHFMIEHLDALGLADEYAKFVYPDKKLLLQYLNIESFVDTADDILLNDNEFLIAMVDVPYCYRYMRKISKIAESNVSLLLSSERPSDVSWADGSIWAEEVRDVYAGGRTLNRDSETNIKELERFLSNRTEERTFPYYVANVEITKIYKRTHDFIVENGNLAKDDSGNDVLRIDKHNLYDFDAADGVAYDATIIPINDEGGES